MRAMFGFSRTAVAALTITATFVAFDVSAQAAGPKRSFNVDKSAYGRGVTRGNFGRGLRSDGPRGGRMPSERVSNGGRGGWDGPRGHGGRIPGIVIPGVIGIIGAIATSPAYSDPGYNDPPPPSRIREPRQPRRQQNAQTPRGGRSGGGGAPPSGETRLVPDEVVVQVPPGTSPQAIARVAARNRLTQIESQTFDLTGETLIRWRIPDRRSVRTVVLALQRDAGVRTVQPNYLFGLRGETSAETKGDPAQYAIGKLHLPEAHALARGDKVLIGVVDSGIDGTHPELAGMIADSFDALPNEPPHNHGTAIAGTIAAHAKLLGVAPAARILAARAFGDKPADAKATTFNVLKGIDWAAKHGARVINMSFAGPRDPAIERELAAATKRRIVLIAAAGNAGPKSAPLYPAADPNVIAVSATDAQDKVFDKSNRGSYISLAAPGVDILAPAPNGAYQVISGTSLSAAYVSGMAALLIERKPGLGPQEVRKVLQATAHDLGPRGRDPEYGSGLADAYEAVKAVEPRTADTLTSQQR